ncbi:hypothetical protein [Marinitenerispora sediminis]|uniref:Uncharacterized protein n=1 Tax=Marinitenerispora sediminis TaxID=1931232 RepID=A0A368SYX3_9ACTN|nr:hypothetical protein [Marinitenerispora sediminis]RCV47774.1 hypothetical protein DEF28_25350 [Marinitenerispora sediminis]RCV48374.1 hypothetical protein DEF23_25125 [Marinitenerispora sediminis]RCV50110.1 hypothetical protein DEF24_24605 [Marinitenerispora sediminis]
MASSELTRAAPLVRYRGGGGHAFLLARVRAADGSWLARITWAEVYLDEPGNWRWETAEVPFADIDRIDTQAYGTVPREYRAADPATPPHSAESRRPRGR